MDGRANERRTIGEAGDLARRRAERRRAILVGDDSGRGMTQAMSRSMRCVLAVLLVPLATAWAAAAAGRLTRLERRAAAAVDRRTPPALVLLERAVGINSGTMNFEGVRSMANLLEPEFETLGFTTQWIDGHGWGRAGHLIAR